MGFPATVNGNTWNLSDFEEGGYHEKLGKFLYDCIADFRQLFFGTSSSSVSVSVGSKSLTASTGKSWVPGMRLRLVYRDSSKDVPIPSTATLAGVVIAYDSNTGAMTLQVRASYGSGSYSSWYIAPGEYGETPGVPLPVQSGGTGLTSSDGVRQFLNKFYPRDQSQLVFEDFTGFFPVADSLTDQNIPGFHVNCSGAGKVYPGGNSLAYLGTADRKAGVLDGNHPGILVLEVSASGDVAKFALSSAPLGCLNPGSSASFMFYIPQLDTEIDRTYFTIGLQMYEGSSNVGDSSYLSPGIAVHWPSQIGDATKADMSVDNPGILGDAVVPGTSGLKSGRWYLLNLENSGTDIAGSIYWRDEKGEEQLEADWTSPAPTQDSRYAYVPFVRLEKTAGSQRRTVLVDYIHWARIATR